MIKKQNEIQNGFIGKQPESEEWVYMKKGQTIAGHAVGILHQDIVHYPLLPGNVVNAYTYDFPVRLKAVTGLDTPQLGAGAPELYEGILAAARELEKEGVRAICSACGFFGRYHKKLAEDMDIPVALSSLVQVPWIKSLLKPNQKIGVLTANESNFDRELLESCLITNPDDIVVGDLRHADHFSAILEDRGCFDNAKVRGEVVSVATQLIDNNPDIGAILLECSDMPPYAAAVQKEVGLLVFDFITLIKWLNNAAVSKPYEGII